MKAMNRTLQMWYTMRRPCISEAEEMMRGPKAKPRRYIVTDSVPMVWLVMWMSRTTYSMPGAIIVAARLLRSVLVTDVDCSWVKL